MGPILPAVCFRYLSCVFRFLLTDGFLIPYMDDPVIPSSDEIDGLQKLILVLYASAYGLNINIKKWQILQWNIKFIGHFIQNSTILHPSQQKFGSVKAVSQFSEPKTVKQLPSFWDLLVIFKNLFLDLHQLLNPFLTCSEIHIHFLLVLKDANSSRQSKNC